MLDSIKGNNIGYGSSHSIYFMEKGKTWIVKFIYWKRNVKEYIFP